ncbi:ATP-binding cassette domain-containing protein [Metabacillus sp. 113a]|uniref:ATP-binding cassette domain-containing protein n=1 Tax=Metabacillus sp. 113a TaxID=3404706 RepID=UPI003CF1CC17
MNMINRLKVYFGPNSKGLYQPLVFSFLLALILPVCVIIVQLIIDETIIMNDYKMFPLEIFLLCLLIAAALILTHLINRAFREFRLRAAAGLKKALRDKLLQLSIHSFDHQAYEQLLSFFTQDVEAIRRFFQRGLHKFFVVPVIIILSLGILFYYSIPLAAGALAASAVLAGIMYRHLRIKANVHIESAHLSDLLSLKGARPSGVVSIQNQKLKGAAVGCSFLFAASGGVLAWYGQLAPGEYAACVCLLALIFIPLGGFGQIAGLWPHFHTSGYRLLAILETPRSVYQPPFPAKDRGMILFDDVVCGYQENHPVLHSLSFELHPGKIIGIIGESGAGKTALAHLLTGFLKPVEGEIKLGGGAGARISSCAVFERSDLEAETVKGNLAFGKPEALMSEIIQAAKAVQAHDFIMELPEQYNTPLAGITLNKAAIQKIAIARALCTMPDILILDDAFMGIEPFEVRRILSNIKKIRGIKTVIVLTRSADTGRCTDEIIFLSNGTASERGTHQELMRNGGLYSRYCFGQLLPAKNKLKGQ